MSKISHVAIRVCDGTGPACESADRRQGLRGYWLVTYPFDVGGWLEVNYCVGGSTRPGVMRLTMPPLKSRTCPYMLEYSPVRDQPDQGCGVPPAL